MRNTYHIKGMTCNGCRADVEERLSKMVGVISAEVNLEKEEATLNMTKPIATTSIQKMLPVKYVIFDKKKEVIINKDYASEVEETSKLKQLKPLFLVLGYILMASILTNLEAWDGVTVMLDFMGIFFFVFSFFKFLDLRGFVNSFVMYDPLARGLRAYAWIYPFIELALGIMIFVRFELEIAMAITVVVLGLTTVGVTLTLFQKKKIQCACLGTALKLPMTLATFIENALMIVMSIFVILELI